MAKVNEIKEQQSVVASVGEFAGSLQQIATMRMTQLRKLVLASRPFVDQATMILRELKREQTRKLLLDIKKTSRKKYSFPYKRTHHMIIIVSSSQGLCGSYNTEIFKKAEEVVKENPDADYFVVGSKGQDYFKRLKSKKYPSLNYYHYNIPENVEIQHLRKLINMFVFYDQIHLVYSKYINTSTREVVFLELAEPLKEEDINPPKPKTKEEKKQLEKMLLDGRFIFEPDIDLLIEHLTNKLRYALFRQQILDSQLSLYSSQMLAMQTASDNAKDLMKDLQMEYNKARRKIIDKKIQEVQAGRALWA
jgi:F-type H+-transporting ATPase subunit gamma